MLKTFVLLNLPFRNADHIQFHKIFRMCRQSVKVPSASMLKSDLHATAEDMRDKIANELASVDSVSLALNAWTSPNKLAFLAVVAYWITSKWEFKYRLIGFEQLHGDHSGANFACKIQKLTKRYDIENKIYAVTTDNASNNGTMAKALEDGVAELNEQTETGLYHIPCLAHFIQLAVMAFTDDLKATATNEQLDRSITDDQVNSIRREQKGFYLTLSKVSTDFIFKRLISTKLDVCECFHSNYSQN